MKTLTRILFIMFFLSAIRCPLNANAAVPHLINYQGRLTDTNNVALNGSYDLTFRLYDAENAGALLWEGTYSGVNISKGIFNILLGDVNNAGYNFANLAFDKSYWLEIKVGAEVMTPRQRISSAGYAIRAGRAEQANNADTVANVGVSTTPVANKLLPLDNNAKLSPSVFKVYDSGWFSIAKGTTYTKDHNLGTKKVICQLYFATDSNGTDMFPIILSNANEGNESQTSSFIQRITSSQVTVQTGENGVANTLASDGSPSNGRRGTQYTSGYVKIIMLSLE